MKLISRHSKLPAGLVVFAFVCFAQAEDKQTMGWQIGTIDTSGSGRHSSLRFDKFGNAHVAYILENSEHPLKYGFWDHNLGRWFTMVVSKSASFCALTLDSKQHPHISYADYGTGKGSKVRYFYWDGDAWKTRPIEVNSDVVAYYTSIGLDANDYPTISYYEYEGPGSGFALRLKAVSWNGMYWEGRTVDPTPGSGKFNSLASGPAGSIHVAYANVRADNASLRYGHWNGQSWDTEILEGLRMPFYTFSVAMTVDGSDNPHIVYTDTANLLIKYASRRNGKWELQAVDSILKEGYPDRNGITVDSHGNPYLSYFDAGRGILKVAYHSGSKWVGEVVDENNAGFGSSIQIDDGMLWVTYADDGGGTFKFARRRLPDAAAQGQGSMPALRRDAR